MQEDPASAPEATEVPAPRKKFTLESALEYAKKYSSRTELWSGDPAVYRWLRINAREELNKLFPHQKVLYYTREEIIDEIQQTKPKSRAEFSKTHPGMYEALRRYPDVRERYLPESKSAQKWTKDAVIKKLESLTEWRDYRNDTGFMAYVKHHGRGEFWYQVWLQLKLNKLRNRQGETNGTARKPRRRKNRNSRKTRNKRSADGKKYASGNRKGAAKTNQARKKLKAKHRPGRTIRSHGVDKKRRPASANRPR